MVYDYLNPENAFIWRIVHCDNLPWLIENGLHCSNTTVKCNTWITIGNQELINKRDSKLVPIKNRGTLNDYVPFYFTPFSPMLYNIHTGFNGITRVNNEDIVILVTSLRTLEEFDTNFVYTDMHAYSVFANFYSDLADLSHIDWAILQRRDFQRDNNDPQKIERYQAEALIYQTLPINKLKAIVCYSDSVKQKIESWLAMHNSNVKVVVREEWYF